MRTAERAGFQPFDEAGGEGRLGVGMIIESVGSLIAGAELLTSSGRDASGEPISEEDRGKANAMVNSFTNVLVRVQKRVNKQAVATYTPVAVIARCNFTRRYKRYYCRRYDCRRYAASPADATPRVLPTLLVPSLRQ